MLIWRAPLFFAVLVHATLASAILENSTLSSTSVTNLTSSEFETLVQEGLHSLRQTIPHFRLSSISARVRRAQLAQGPEDFQFIQIRVYDLKSGNVFRIQNTLAAPSLWLLPEKMPGPISTKITTWSLASLSMSMEKALWILKRSGFPGPWISVYIFALRENPFDEPAGEIYYAFAMVAGSDIFSYFVGSHTGRVHVQKRPGSSVGSDDGNLASFDGTFLVSAVGLKNSTIEDL